MTQKIEEKIIINALPATVWENLPNTKLMAKWMGEPEMKIDVFTDWKVGRPIFVNEFHHVNFENKDFNNVYFLTILYTFTRPS